MHNLEPVGASDLHTHEMNRCQDASLYINPFQAMSPSEVSMDRHPPRNGSLSLTMDDFIVANVLGSGAFGLVHMVKPRRSCSDKTENDDLTPSLSSERSLVPVVGERFALKRLNEKAMATSTTKHQIAVHGFKIEAEILSSLPKHSNVILLQGLSKDFFENPEKGFILLELLHETLTQKLRMWRNRKSLNKNPWVPKSPKKMLLQPKVDPEQRDRIISIGIGIAKAMAFLHQHRVLFRDLKPDNVGFDGLGNVKIFDFGLSRFSEEGENDEKDGTEKMVTMCVGTPRYMAPEVANGMPYGCSADVHSFGILLWEVITLKRAFSRQRSIEALYKSVYDGNKRPSLNRISTSSIRGLLRNSWNPLPELRPSFTSVVTILEIYKGGKKASTMAAAPIVVPVHQTGRTVAGVA